MRSCAQPLVIRISNIFWGSGGGNTIQSKYFSAEMDFSLHPAPPVQILLAIQSLIDFHLCQEVAHNSPQPLPRGNNILPLL